MELSNQEVEGLIREGVAALQGGRSADARALFERVARTGRANAQIWLLLAVACRAEGDWEAQESAVDQLLALQPQLPRGLIMKADCRAHAGVEDAALGFYKSALSIAYGQPVPRELQGELDRAEAAARAIETAIHQKRDAALSAQGVPPENRSARFQQSLDILSGQRRIFLQRPTGYYFPELPHVQFFDTAQFDWVSAVEAATPAIRGELAALLASSREGFRPYIQSDPNQPRLDDNALLDNLDWSALFLVENGRPNEAMIARCPVTWATMQAVPQARMTNSPTVMFSLLQPGAHIAPHTGTHNIRLVCHLPLIVPPNCGFRVGNETREWEEGKVLIFDDTIEHEAWNRSDRDRVVLIFDVWRPELSEQERGEVAALFAGFSLASRA